MPVSSRQSPVVSQEREAALAAAADVDGDAAQRSGSPSCSLDQVDEVVDVEQVADLLAGAAVADVGSGRPKWRQQPVVKTPWSTLPICQGPAITPQRLTTARIPKASAYSATRSSTASLVVP